MLDLEKVKKIIFDNVEILLENLSMEYECLGDNIYSTCSVHEGSDNKRALSISKSKMRWRCWTRGCHEHYNSDIFGLVRGTLSSQSGEEVVFSDVLKFICKIYNIKHQKLNPSKQEIVVDDNFSSLVKIFNHKQYEETYSDYQEILTGGPSEYFMGRGFKKKTLEHFGISDCIDKQSPMHGRSIIPIHCHEGNTIGYIARAIKDYITPKFLFSKDFKKTNHLYNHHGAIDKASELSCLFIVEGQGDVWRLYEAGVYNCVSIFGKSISRRQYDKILCSGVTKLVILTDNDQPGRESKMQIQRQFSRMFTVKFPRLKNKDVGDMAIEKIEEQILPQVKGLY